MTAIDWFGVVITVIIAIILSVAYFYAFRPKNKQQFEENGNIPLNED